MVGKGEEGGWQQCWSAPPGTSVQGTSPPFSPRPRARISRGSGKGCETFSLGKMITAKAGKTPIQVLHEYQWIPNEDQKHPGL